MSFGGLSLRDIEYVVAIADTGSFTAAAEHCGVSQPSLSGQVRKVEALLGLRLFERTGREVRTTAAGAGLIEQARNVLGEARRLIDMARTLNDPLAEPLRLGVIATLAPYLVPHLLGPLRGRFPDLRLILREGLTAELSSLLVSGQLDAVLLSLPVEDDRLAAHAILFEPFVGICPAGSPLAGRPRVAMSDLDTDDLLLMDEGHCIRDQALAACARPRARQDTRHAASIETLRHLVAAGTGHALLPRMAVRSDPLLDRHLSYVELEDESVGRTVGLAWRRTDVRRQSFEALAAFMAGIEIPGTRGLRPDPLRRHPPVKPEHDGC
jgi:LysR family transcriptional regulator, hydrogen peroxide-inducible genes activator